MAVSTPLLQARIKFKLQQRMRPVMQLAQWQLLRSCQSRLVRFQVLPAVGITGTPTPIATNATASFAAPSISGYSAVAVSYAANTNTSALVTSTTNLLVTSAASSNNIQIQYKDIEAPKMSLTNTVTYQQNETINSSDMVNRLVTSLGDNSPKAVTTSLTLSLIHI